VLEATHDSDQIIQRIAALDVGKAELTCCVRVRGQGGSGRRTGGGPDLPDDDPLAAGAGRPAGELGVTRVVMEATSDSWKGIYYLLEAHGFETLAGQRR
jgi:transposase